MNVLAPPLASTRLPAYLQRVTEQKKRGQGNGVNARPGSPHFCLLALPIQVWILWTELEKLASLISECILLPTFDGVKLSLMHLVRSLEVCCTHLLVMKINWYSHNLNRTGRGLKDSSSYQDKKFS